MKMTKSYIITKSNTSSPEQHGRRFANDIVVSRSDPIPREIPATKLKHLE